MGEYGYKGQRPDPPPRQIAGGQSRVTLPNKEETRRTDLVSKTNFGVPTPILSNVDQFYHYPRIEAASSYVGKSSAFQPSSTTRWNADIKRYSRNLTTAGSAFADRYQIGMSARALVDPLYPPSGIIVKVQDLVRAFFKGAINAQTSKAVIFMAGQQGGSAAAIEIAAIGWSARHVNFGVQPTWFTEYSSKNGGIVRQIDSGLQCDTPRLLSWVLDGKNQQIRWYANGVLVDTYSPSAGEVGGQNTLLGRETITYLLNRSGGVTPADDATLDFLMLGAPLVTIQFPDA